MSETEPLAKKAKVAADEEDDDEEEEFEEEEEDVTAAAPAAKTNDEGDKFFELSNTRRCTVRTFKGKILVDIREYYEKDGEMRPGKKGISLNKDQYDVLAALFKSGSINAEVAKLVK